MGGEGVGRGGIFGKRQDDSGDTGGGRHRQSLEIGRAIRETVTSFSLRLAKDGCPLFLVAIIPGTR